MSSRGPRDEQARTRRKRLLDLSGTGDDGTTGLLGGGRTSKDDPRIEAFGTVDEASSALGLARALTKDARVRSICEELQRGMYAVGAELGTNPRAEKVFVLTGDAQIGRLEQLIGEIEAEVTMPDGFILPGATAAGAAIDLARAITRRAERRTLTLENAGGLDNPGVRRWLNRLSLLLFVLARYEEGQAGRRAKPAKK
jgi:cob(I)alamin adenosyltransferase